MSRTKTSFKNYAAASRFMRKLGLTSMQDWIDFSKGQGPNGATRPKDIPSNPWTVYGPQLEAEGKKFSINEFLGSKKVAKRVAKKAVVKKTATKVTPADKRGKRVAKSVTSTVEKPLTLTKTVSDKPLSYSASRAALRKMHVKSQADFNALARMKLLPPQLPKNPSQEFKSQWKNWKTFLAA